VLEVNNLQFSYKNNEVLKGVKFDVRLNQIVGICGTTSSGKSSIFETILNFKDFSNGTIIFENRKVAYNIKSQINSLRKKIGYVTQNDYLLTYGTVLDTFKWTCKTSKDKIIELASLTGITDILYSNIQNISNIEKMKLKLAISLIDSPEILFVDEPLTSLKIGDEVDNFLNLIEDVSKSKNMGVIISSQNIQGLKKDRFHKIYLLENGVLNEV